MKNLAVIVFFIVAGLILAQEDQYVNYRIDVLSEKIASHFG